MTSRIAMRRPSVSEVSNPAPSGGGFTIVRVDAPVLGLVERRPADVARSVEVRSWQKLQPCGAPS